MNFYELSILTVAHRGLSIAEAAIMRFLNCKEASGTMVGLWRTVAGPVNQIVLLRGFDSRPDLVAERDRARRSDNPFCCGHALRGLEMASFVPFASSPPVAPGLHGGLCKLTSYNIRPAALSAMERRWNTALDAGLSPDTIAVMYPMDGMPRVLELAACRKGADNPLGGGLTLSEDDLEDLCWPDTKVSALMPLPSSQLVQTQSGSTIPA